MAAELEISSRARNSWQSLGICGVLSWELTAERGICGGAINSRQSWEVVARQLTYPPRKKGEDFKCHFHTTESTQNRHRHSLVTTQFVS